MANGYKTGGRQKGSINRSTANAREAIGRLVDGNAGRLQAWLDQIAETDGPKAAWACMMDVIEYHIPKLARTELTGEGGGAVQIAAVDLTSASPEQLQALASMKLKGE